MSNRPGRHHPGLRDRYAAQEQRRHRRTVAWQVVVGAIAAAGVLAGVVALVLTSGGGDGDAAAAHPDVSVELGCASCHTTDGRRSEGPTWAGLAGSPVELADGTTVTADSDYLRRSITDPGAQVVAGYGPTMPTVEVTDAQLEELVAFIQSLGTAG